jgi:hypothetical protein
MKEPPRNQMPPIVLRAKPPVLKSESATEYISLHAQLVQEVEPKGPIEEIYVEEMAALIWEIRRLRNCKINTIHQAFPQALQSILEQLSFNPDVLVIIDPENWAKALALRWFEDSTKKNEVLQILGRFGLDESAIEAEAIKLMSDHLQWLDRALAVASARLDKALRIVMDYRNSFAVRLRRHSKQTLIEHDAKNKSVA